MDTMRRGIGRDSVAKSNLRNAVIAANILCLVVCHGIFAVDKHAVYAWRDYPCNAGGTDFNGMYPFRDVFAPKPWITNVFVNVDGAKSDYVLRGNYGYKYGPGWMILTWREGASQTPPGKYIHYVGGSPAGHVDVWPDDCNPTDPDRGKTLPGGEQPPSDETDPDSEDPINVISGNNSVDAVDVVAPCPGISLDFSRSYNSLQADTVSSIGAGWMHSYDWFITETNDVKYSTYTNEWVRLHMGSGRTLAFLANDKSENGQFDPPVGSESGRGK